MKPKPVVIVSSTARDLPEYREQVKDACLRVDMFPKMMEQLPASDADAIRASLELVDEADVYVGVFAHRYGYIPAGHDISITQMEYEHAVKRGIPRLIFVMDDDVPVLPKDVDKGESAEKLETLKDRMKKEQVVAFFKSPEDLRGHVIHSLSEARKQLDARAEGEDEPAGAALARSLHYVSEIPHPPEPYIAHPYTLLQVRNLVGRKEELELLTDWVTGKRGLADIRIFNVVAIGGMGKSALTWTWFNEVAPQEMAPLAGRLWWSFYESDATFENFVTRALAYVSKRSLEEVKKISFPEQEDQLLRILDREPYLIALDGLERILVAYARLDAAYIRDEGGLDEETSNRVAGAMGLPASAGQSFVGKHKLRMTADLRAGRFLRELARVRASRVLVSSRLYPADLQAPLGDPLPGCFALFLTGLSDQDALALWRTYGAKGSRERTLPVFHTFDKHPLLIQLLAYEVAEFRDAPGDFDAWKAANPDFNPFGLELANVQSHVLAYALRGLSAAELRTLHVIAGFRMPANMDTIKALLIRSNDSVEPSYQPFTTVRDLDYALSALEDRGLLGWDRRANRYDLHPIVRGVVWTALDSSTRLGLYDMLRTHFEAISPIRSYLAIETIDDLTPAIELYNTLIGLERYDDAFAVFNAQISRATLWRLSANRLRIELLKPLFPDDQAAPPRLRLENHIVALTELALAYQLSGQPGASVKLFALADQLDVANNGKSSGILLANLSDALRPIGQLRAAEAAARRALIIAREEEDVFDEGVSLQWIGLILGARGLAAEARDTVQRCLRIWESRSNRQGEGLVYAILAEMSLWEGNAATALLQVNSAWELAHVDRNEYDYVRAARLHGAVALHLGNFVRAGERLNHALVRARTASLVEEELPCLATIAELYRHQNEAVQARAMLDEMWDLAELGPFPLLHADALNVLAQIERDEGNTDAAIEAATKAYRLAWCDGPPFAYHWGLEKARAHLAALGAPEPDMPPFDESKYEPMPEVEINLPDEFGGDELPEVEDE